MNNQNIQKYKKILCKSIINNKNCDYGKNCLYAHSYSEQKMSINRKLAYDIIKGKIKINENNNTIKKELYDILCILSKLCTECEKNKCTGGYNCIHGSVSRNLQICRSDLDTGICKNRNCGLIHLTQKGLKPYNNSIFVSQTLCDSNDPTKNNIVDTNIATIDDNDINMFFTNMMTSSSDDDNLFNIIDDQNNIESTISIPQYNDDNINEKLLKSSIFGNEYNIV